MFYVVFSDRRLADHFGGKLHLGYMQIREKLAELQVRLFISIFELISLGYWAFIFFLLKKGCQAEIANK